jgi:hypothetical protein
MTPEQQETITQLFTELLDEWADYAETVIHDRGKPSVELAELEQERAAYQRRFDAWVATVGGTPASTIDKP